MLCAARANLNLHPKHDNKKMQLVKWKSSSTSSNQIETRFLIEEIHGRLK